MKGRDFSGIEKHVDGQPRNNGQNSFSGEVKESSRTPPGLVCRYCPANSTDRQTKNPPFKRNASTSRTERKPKGKSGLTYFSTLCSERDIARGSTCRSHLPSVGLLGFWPHRAARRESKVLSHSFHMPDNAFSAPTT